MTKRTGIFAAVFFALGCLEARGQCLNEFLDSVNAPLIAMHDGRYHVTFNFASKKLPNTVFYEGTAYFSKDSAITDETADFIMFEKDTIPVFAFMDEYFYQFDVAQKKYTRQYLRRNDFFSKTTSDFQHFLAVPYLLNKAQSPFDGLLNIRVDSPFCSKKIAGYMTVDTMTSQQLGRQLRKTYCYVQRSTDGNTIEIHNSMEFNGGNDRSRVWIIDSMAPIKQGEKFVRGKINQYIKGFVQTEAKDLDDRNWVPPAPPPLYGEKLKLDTVPVNTFLKTMEYKPFSLDNTGGKLLLLDFWYAKCHPCVEAMPKLDSLYNAYKGKGLAVVGINTYDYDMDIVKNILDKNGVEYPICLDSEQEMMTELGIGIFPTILLVDPISKKIYYSFIGPTDFTKLEKNINLLLKAR